MSLDEGLRKKIREANVAVHRVEAEYYELIHAEIYGRFEQERLWSTLKMVDHLVGDNRVPPKKALDVGAGTGNLTGKLLQMGYHVTALDISAEMCAILKRNYKQYLDSQKLVVVNSPIEDVSFGRGEFDLVACYSVLHHLPDYVGAVQRFSDFLKKGGVMYLEHEVSPFFWKPKATGAADVVKSIYFHSNLLLNALYFRLARIKVPFITYDLSDYWYNEKHPLDHEKIRYAFERMGFDFFKRTDYYIKFRTWIPNPLFYLYRSTCKPEMSFWVAKK